MRATVVYESMYGNTRSVAEAIGRGLRAAASTVPVSVTVTRVGDVDAEALRALDLLVVGGPTHAWGLSRPSTRRTAVEAAAKPGSRLTVEPGADGPGLREWLEDLRCVPTRVAAFDTHMKAPLGLSGSAARRIARRLKACGFLQAGRPEQFLVSKQNRLEPGEVDRATRWGETLAIGLHRLGHDLGHDRAQST